MTKIQFLNNFQKNQKIQFSFGFQNWWTDFVFHYNDLHNIVSILDSGKLYSRNRAKNLGVLKTDIANDEVISHTNIAVYDYVRFYFGAKTPTLYHNEGIKPLHTIQHNAHCPIPIFLLFDFVKILSIDDVYFSNGNVGATTPEIYDDIKILPQLEWQYIYHRDSLWGYSPEKLRHIVYCRNAEILVKDEINVYDFLKWICVRSEADKETLLHLVRDTTREQIKNKIKVFTQDGLFHNKQLYLKKILLDKNTISIDFANINNESFFLEVQAISIANDKRLHYSQKNYNITSDLIWDVTGLDKTYGINFILKIDSNLIYNNVLFDINEILI